MPSNGSAFYEEEDTNFDLDDNDEQHNDLYAFILAIMIDCWNVLKGQQSGHSRGTCTFFILLKYRYEFLQATGVREKEIDL
ncbi:unnamed protein product [Caenorhabditis sp. 36 PRJEB53466]|nr:unnamed protein product [Caenorhabditis sp. 36 PRJEB53466]